ncbi:FAD-dependent oxidoreductase, partial [Lentzea aerocolonigenes]|uniref:FAD-dependent oxidoreductase n=1 Tax=Lentzea aerocolonigenes TaxID=68170 RepID=UPI0004C41DA8
MSSVEVAVVGGGVIGLSVAWCAARAGFSVSLSDLGSPHAGSRVAGGMLAPVAEAWHGEETVTAQGVEALVLWPEFAAALGVELFNKGTITVATSPGDLADLRRIVELFNNPDVESLNNPQVGSLTARGVGSLNNPSVGSLNNPGVELLNSRAIRQLEPSLGPAVRGGMFVPGDLAVDNRELLSALRKACVEAGVKFESTVDDSALEARPATTTTRPATTTTQLAAATTQPATTTTHRAVTVIAAGAWSGNLHPALKDVIRPVKGEILRLAWRPGTLPPPTRTIRGSVSGRSVYLVPRHDGIVVGATQYEAGFDTDVTVAGVRDLLRDAETVLPGIAEYALTEAAVGFRAGSPDNVPVVRWLEPGVIAATGHHRNGLLLAPHTAREVVELLKGGSS